MEPSDSPMSAENTQKAICAPDALIELMRAEMKNTMASGARITTHLKADAKMKLPKLVSWRPASVCVTAMAKVR